MTPVLLSLGDRASVQRLHETARQPGSRTAVQFREAQCARSQMSTPLQQSLQVRTHVHARRTELLRNRHCNT